MELVELHVRDLGERAVAHGDARAAGDVRVAGVEVDLAAAARGERGGEGCDRDDGVLTAVQRIRADAAVLAHPAHVPGADEVDRHVVFEHVDVRVGAAGGDEGTFDLLAGDVARVEDAALVVAALASEVEVAVSGFGRGLAHLLARGKVRADVVDEPLDALRAAPHDVHDGLRTAQMRPRLKRVGEVFLEGVADVCHAGDAALRHLRVAVVDGAFRDDADGSGVMFREHEGGGKPCKTASYDQMVEITFLGCLHFFRPKSQKRFLISTNMI